MQFCFGAQLICLRNRPKITTSKCKKTGEQKRRASKRAEQLGRGQKGREAKRTRKKSKRCCRTDRIMFIHNENNVVCQLKRRAQKICRQIAFVGGHNARIPATAAAFRWRFSTFLHRASPLFRSRKPKKQSLKSHSLCWLI